MQAILALSDGSVFYGRSLGHIGVTSGELVFNTSMSGYQEIITDPSYAGQVITFTCPHIGNVGINAFDHECDQVFTRGIVIRSYTEHESNWRSEQSLEAFLKENKVVAITEVDTRAITHILREKGAQNVCIMSGETINEEEAIAIAQGERKLEGLDLAQEVSTHEAYQWDTGLYDLNTGQENKLKNPEYHIVAYDFGIKKNILRLLTERHCKITVVPAKTPASEVLSLNPDGIFLSNGPGDPAACHYAIQATKELIQTGIPIFGICLGFQILALASGAETNKMLFGHHGANHPIICNETQRVMITSQNHGFAVNEENLPKNLTVTHRSLFDGTLQGIEHTETSAFGLQGHPEASPGPQDAIQLFDKFIEAMKSHAKKN